MSKLLQTQTLRGTDNGSDRCERNHVVPTRRPKPLLRREATRWSRPGPVERMRALQCPKALTPDSTYSR